MLSPGGRPSKSPLKRGKRRVFPSLACRLVTPPNVYASRPHRTPSGAPRRVASASDAERNTPPRCVRWRRVAAGGDAMRTRATRRLRRRRRVVASALGARAISNWNRARRRRANSTRTRTFRARARDDIDEGIKVRLVRGRCAARRGVAARRGGDWSRSHRARAVPRWRVHRAAGERASAR